MQKYKVIYTINGEKQTEFVTTDYEEFETLLALLEGMYDTEEEHTHVVLKLNSKEDGAQELSDAINRLSERKEISPPLSPAEFAKKAKVHVGIMKETFEELHGAKGSHMVQLFRKEEKE